MNKRVKLLILINSILLIPNIALAEDDKSYNLIANASNAILSALSWIGYALALRNINLDRNKISFEWS